MQGNEIQAILANVSVVNDNVKEVYDKIIKSAPTDISPIVLGINNMYQLLSGQITELKASVNANTEALNEFTEIIKTIPGVTIPAEEQVSEIQNAKSRKK